MSVFTNEGEGIGKVVCNNWNTGLAQVQIDKVTPKQAIYKVQDHIIHFWFPFWMEEYWEWQEINFQKR